MRKILVFVFLSLVLMGGVAFAVPTKMNFQGKLTDSGGNPITTAVEVKFSIFDASSGGTELWTETISGLTPDQGLMNQELGLTTPLTSGVFGGDTRYLAIKVGTDAEMTPRIPLASVPFAFRAAVADSIVAGQAITSLASTGATPLRDAVTLSGGSGISLIQAGQDIQITAVSTAGGTVTQVNTGSGLTGGPINTAGTVSIAAGGINATHLGSGVVTNDAIASDTITEPKIHVMNDPVNNYLLTYTATGLAWGVAGGTGTVTQVDTGSGLAGGPINTTGTVSIAAGGINATHLGTGIVTAGAIASNAVITAGISNGAVTAAKIGSGQVVTSFASSGAAALHDAVTLSGGSGISLVQAGQNIQITAVSTAGGTVSQVNTQAPLLGGPITATGTISIPASSATTDGYLTSVDWNIFNNKLGSADLSGYVQLGPTTQQSTTAAYAINVKTTNATGFGISSEVNTAAGKAVTGINNYSTGGMAGYFQGGQVSAGGLSVGVRGSIPGGTTYGDLAHYVLIEDSGTTKTGVYGFTSDNGSGVYGQGDQVGVLGSTTSLTGTGVRGLADSAGGANIGGYFRSGSTSGGYGVYAFASGSSGTNYALYARTSSPVDGYAVYAEGGRSYFGGYTGIGTDNPQAMLHVEGNLKVTGTIEGGSPVKFAGGIRVANETDATAGNIRWNGSHFEGFNGTGWVSFDASGVGGSGTVTQVNTSSPITGGPITTTGTIAINQAGAGQSGYLSSADWNTFNNKGSGTIGGSAASSKVPYGSGANTLTYATNFDFDGTSLSVGTTGKAGRIYGYYSATQYGYLGDATYGVYGRGSTGVYGTDGTRFGQLGTAAFGATGQNGSIYGYLASSSYGAYGYYDVNDYGFLGSSNRGVYGYSSAGYGVDGVTTSGIGVQGTYNGSRYGYLGSASYGAYGLYDANNFGFLGSSNYGVYGYTTATAGYGVYGLNAGATGNSVGVYGNSSSSTGRGVNGYASGSGVCYGVYGETNSVSGIGVRGNSQADPSNRYGYLGSNSYGSYGTYNGTIYGYLGGGSYGVYGTDGTRFGYIGSTNYGVYGYYNATNYGYLGSASYGVYGRGTTGVYGEDGTRSGALATSSYGATGTYGARTGYLGGASYGGYGANGTIFGYLGGGSYGAYGYYDASNYGYLASSSKGAYGITSDNSGVGIHGVATANTATCVAVQGEATGTTAANTGVYGTTLSSAGYGVYGYANNSSGTNFGSYGATLSASGYGVYGLNNHGSSGGVGVFGRGGTANTNGTYSFGVKGEAAGSSAYYGVLGYNYYADATNHRAGVYGTDGTRYGFLGEGTYGAYGYGGTSIYGFLGSGGTGAYGRNASVYGYLGSSAYAVYGYYDAGHNGYIGGSSNGVYGHASGSGHYGAYGYNDDAAGVGVFGYCPSGGAGWAVYASGGRLGTGNAQTGATKSVYDVAELIPCASDVSSGDVVVIHTGKYREATKCTIEADDKALGVISYLPQLSIGDRDETNKMNPGMNWQYVALAGQVPCKVSIMNGPINPGDLLTTSDIPGHAVKAIKPSQVIGKALEKFDGSSGSSGQILVFCNVSWYGGDQQKEIEELKSRLKALEDKINK